MRQIVWPQHGLDGLSCGQQIFPQDTGQGATGQWRCQQDTSPFHEDIAARPLGDFTALDKVDLEVKTAAGLMAESGKLRAGGASIVNIASAAADRATAMSGAYCASKAAFSMYLDAARLELKRKNVAVTAILPGFVVTDIMPKIEKFPFAVPAAQAAREIVTLIEQRKPVGVVPAWPWKWLRPFFGHFPDSLWNKLA